MERQAPIRPEDGDGVGEPVQGLVMGVRVALQLLARLFGVRGVKGHGRRAAAFQRQGGDLHGLALAAYRDKAHARARLSGLGRFQRHLFGGAIKHGAARDRLLDAARLGGDQPGSVGPDQFAAWRGDPRGVRKPIEKRRESRRRRQARRSRLGQPQPGHGARHPPLDRQGAANAGFSLARHFEITGLAPLKKGGQALGMVLVPAQGLDHRLGFGPDRKTKQGEARDHAMGAPGHTDLASLNGQEDVVKGVGGGLCGFGAGLLAGGFKLDLRHRLPGFAPLGQGPQHRRQGQTGPAACCKKGRIQAAHHPECP